MALIMLAQPFAGYGDGPFQHNVGLHIGITVNVSGGR